MIACLPKRLVAALAVAILGQSVALAQSVNVHGYVQNTGGSRVPCVALQVQPGGIELPLSPDGSFSINLPQGTSYTLNAIAAGDVLGSQAIEAGSNRPVVITLAQVYHCTQEAELTGQRATKARVQAAEIENNIILATKKTEIINLEKTDANLATNNARQAFARVPGVQVWENDASGVQINVATRGLSPNRSWEFNVRQNGYDVSSDPMGYPESYYNPPLEAVRQVQFIRGAAGLQFGPQFGGVLNYVIGQNSTKPFSFTTQQTLGSYGLFSSFNAIGGTVGKFSYYGFYNTRKGDGWRNNSHFNLESSHLQLAYQFTSRLRLGAEITNYAYVSQQPGGLTDAQFAADPRQSLRARNWFGTPFIIPALNLDWQLATNTHLTVKTWANIGQRNSVGYTGAVNIPDTLMADKKYRERTVARDFYRNYGAEARLHHNYGLGNTRHDLVVGARYFTGHTDRMSNGKGTKGTDFDLATSRYGTTYDLGNDNIAAFAENIFRLGKRLTVTPGARIEHIKTSTSGRNDVGSNLAVLMPNQSRSRTLALFGLGAEYKITETVNAYGNISQAYRPVLFSNLSPTTTTDLFDPNMKDSYGHNADLGLRGSLFDQVIVFDASAFYLKYNNRVGSLRVPNPDGSLQPNGQPNTVTWWTNVGASTSRGFEIYAEADVLKPISSRLGRLAPFASLAFIDARYDGFQVAEGTSTTRTIDLKGKRVQDAPRQIHRVGANYSIGNLSITYTHSIVSEAYSDAANTDAANATGQVGKIPAYQVADLGVTLGFLQHYNVKAGINNLYDARYFTRRAGGYPGPGLLPNEARTFYVSAGARF